MVCSFTEGDGPDRGILQFRRIIFAIAVETGVVGTISAESLEPGSQIFPCAVKCHAGVIGGQAQFSRSGLHGLSFQIDASQECRVLRFKSVNYTT